MFTIKHLTPHGNEALYTATNLQFCPVEGTHTDMPVGFAKDPLGVLYYRSPGDSVVKPLEQIDNGQIYVMNEAGSTVAHYDLGGWVQST